MILTKLRQSLKKHLQWVARGAPAEQTRPRWTPRIPAAGEEVSFNQKTLPKLICALFTWAVVQPPRLLKHKNILR